MMFSATMNQNVKNLTKEFLTTDPVVIEVAQQRSSVKIIQIIEVDEAQKHHYFLLLNWFKKLLSSFSFCKYENRS